MNYILDQINALSPFEQSMFGSAVFAFSLWLARLLYTKIKQSGSYLLTNYSKLDVVKHTLHKEYVNSNNVQLASFGASIALLQASRWIIIGVQIALFFWGIHSIANREWLFVAASWFCFNCALEASSWVKDTSKDKHVKHVPKKVINEIYESLKPKFNTEKINS